MLSELLQELKNKKDEKRAKILSGFFKTGKGEYGEGDLFLGITVPVQRKIAGRYTSLNLEDINKLLESKVHEHRLVALMILVDKFAKTNDKENSKL